MARGRVRSGGADDYFRRAGCRGASTGRNAHVRDHGNAPMRRRVTRIRSRVRVGDQLEDVDRLAHLRMPPRATALHGLRAGRGRARRRPPPQRYEHEWPRLLDRRGPVFVARTVGGVGEPPLPADRLEASAQILRLQIVPGRILFLAGNPHEQHYEEH